MTIDIQTLAHMLPSIPAHTAPPTTAFYLSFSLVLPLSPLCDCLPQCVSHSRDGSTTDGSKHVRSVTARNLEVPRVPYHDTRTPQKIQHIGRQTTHGLDPHKGAAKLSHDDSWLSVTAVLHSCGDVASSTEDRVEERWHWCQRGVGWIWVAADSGAPAGCCCACKMSELVQPARCLYWSWRRCLLHLRDGVSGRRLRHQ